MLVCRGERAQHDVFVPQLLGGHSSLAPQHRVDSSLLVGHLPAGLETPDRRQYRDTSGEFKNSILPSAHVTLERLRFELFELNQILARLHPVAAGRLLGEI